jgi:Ca2+-binding RTX toxin-like protein
VNLSLAGPQEVRSGIFHTIKNVENLLGTALDNDKLTGDAKDNVIDGGDGDDVLIGGLGTDIIDGGAGDDDIEIQLVGGDVIVRNFERGDQLDLSAFGKLDFDQLMVRGLAASSDTMLDLGDRTIVLQDFAPGELTADCFLWA